MATLHPQECYLLEKFISPEHYAATRDAVIAYIDAHEEALARYKRELPKNVRARPLWQQADVVWESRVMRNIRPLRDHFVLRTVERQYGDPKAFKMGAAMAYINKGISDSWDGWMTEEERAKISACFSLASELDDRLSITLQGEWGEGDLTYKGQGGIYKNADLPRRIPRYRLDTSVRIEADESPEQTGFYLPDVEYAAACFITEDFGRPVEAYQGVKRSEWVNENTGKRDYTWDESEWIPSGWTLIRRVEGEFIDVPPEGFFPLGIPDELYSWPEREERWLRRHWVHMTRFTGELAPHGGRWAAMAYGVTRYCQVEQGAPLPEHEDLRGNWHPVSWTLIERDDGGDVLVPPAAETRS